MLLEELNTLLPQALRPPVLFLGHRFQFDLRADELAASAMIGIPGLLKRIGVDQPDGSIARAFDDGLR